MTEVFTVLAGLLSFVIIGLSVLGLLNVRFELLQKSALAFGIGGGVVALELFILSALTLPINLFTVLAPWYVIFAYLLKKRKIIDYQSTKSDGLVFVDYILLTLILISVIVSISYVFLDPVSAWDAIASWSMLAKGFFYERSLTGDFYRFFNFENPPLVSLQQSFLAILLGEYNDHEVMLLYPAYFISLLALFYTFVKQFSTKTNALIFTFLLASLPLVLGQAGRFNVGYIDLPLAYYIFSGVVVLAYFLKLPKIQPAILLGIMLGLIALAKNEGMSIALIIFIVAGYESIKKNDFKLILYLLCGILPFFFWKLYAAAEGLPVHPLYNGVIELSRVTAILKAFFEEMTSIRKWSVLWVSFVLSLFLFTSSKLIKIVILIIFAQLIFYFGIYIYTPVDFVSHINSSLDRFLLQISPLAMLVVASAFAKPAIYK